MASQNKQREPLRIRRKVQLSKLIIPLPDFKPVNQEALMKAKKKLKMRRKRRIMKDVTNCKQSRGMKRTAEVAGLKDQFL